MAIKVRNNPNELLIALVYAYNAMQSQVVTDGYHRDLTQVTTSPLTSLEAITVTTVSVSAATAVDLPTTLTLTNQLAAVLNLHMSDNQAHVVADGYNNPVTDGYAVAVDLPSAQTNLTAMKALFTAHLTQTVGSTAVHVHNDTTAYGLPAAATNLATAIALANALKTAVNAHISNAGTSFNVPRLSITSN